MQKNVVNMLRTDHGKVPKLESIHIDTPQKYEKNVKACKWVCERVVGDEMVVRPSIVTESLMKAEEGSMWGITQNAER
jgi:hypothetical protein